MVEYGRARVAADHLRVRAELERSRPALMVTLMLAAAASAVGEDLTAWPWFAGLLLGLFLLPPLLHRALPRGNLFTYRLGLVGYPINAFLLGFIAYLETSKLPPPALEELPALAWLYPALTGAVPLAYLVLRYPDWRHRLRSHRPILESLHAPGDPEALAAVQDMGERALKPGQGPGRAEFRTVPAAPRDWKRYLRLDLERHGAWQVVFDEDFALVVASDGTRIEAVPRGGLRIAAEDPLPGDKPFLCLVRWNDHLREGRIRQDSLAVIQAWNLRTVPQPA